MSRPCPFPHKRSYPSKRSARQGIRTLYKNRAAGGPGRLHAYRCPSGEHWHVGHRR